MTGQGRRFTCKLALVAPWYGENIPGGAEAECRILAKTLFDYGIDVEVLTTCVRDFRSDWSENHHAEGSCVENGIVVRRFGVRPRNTRAFDAVNWKLMNGVSVSEVEERVYMAEMINSPGLYEYIGSHGRDYVFLFIPYMFGTTYWGSRICPERSVLIPCLHDEPYAQMGVIAEIFQRVRGVIFHSLAESELATRLYSLDAKRGAILGEPVDCNWSGEGARFQRKYGVENFLLYAGRRDKGKNADLLAEYFKRYISETGSRIRLVFIGERTAGEPLASDGIVSLGFIPVQDKYDCYAAALAVCVPSVMESFSLAMMEGWLAETPAVVSGRCAVTAGFCRESNGGLYFTDYEEFREIVSVLESRPELVKMLGRQGREFVRANFEPRVVAERYRAALERWFGDERQKD